MYFWMYREVSVILRANLLFFVAWKIDHILWNEDWVAQGITNEI